MEYMEQQMQQQIEAGINERERCYSEIVELEHLRDALAAKVVAVEAERDELAAKLATLEADVLDREADFILSAPADSGVKWSKSLIDAYQRIGSVMKSRAALARARVGAE